MGMSSDHHEPAILIASASAGSGHTTAGNALREAFRERLPDAVVEHVDVLYLTSPVIRTAYGGGFELMASHAPWLWRQLYRRTDGTLDRARWGSSAERTLFRPFRRLLASRRWELVVCTHFLPGQLAAGRTRNPFAMVVTDFTLHRYWVQPEIGRYFVATPEMVDELHRRMPDARADAIGIPVGRAFSRAPGREAARARLGIGTDARVVLVMGGGMGLGVADTTRALLDTGPDDIGIIAVAARNDQARNELLALGLPGSRLRVHGLVDNVPTLMAAADLLVTKPGGLTSSEALAMARPLVVSRALPGNEEGNARALTRAGAALHAPRPADVPAAVTKALTEPGRLQAMAAAAQRLARPDAASDIADTLLASGRLADVASRPDAQ
jgi:processive 1,2-diacylglycerol beta-glucosyltransferase